MIVSLDGISAEEIAHFATVLESEHIERPPLSCLNHNLALLANVVISVQDRGDVVLNTSSYVDNPGLGKNSVTLATLHL
eukprot:13993065-Ditylum_brightwellii.AAC.1